MRDPVKAAESKKRHRERRKIEKYGPSAIGVDMRGRHGNHARGPNNARWNNGRYHTEHGYTAIAVPEGHHLRQAHGYAYEHDLVAEQMLGRKLTREEVVHHRNGNRSDNRPENLEVTTRSEHSRSHCAAPGVRDDLGRFRAGVARNTDPGEQPEVPHAQPEFPARRDT